MNNTKSRLGRGLSAIISATAKEDVVVQDQPIGKSKKEELKASDLKSISSVEFVREIEINLIKPNPYQPRRSIDQERVIELAESIKNQGLIQPITVREVKGGFELIAGERRWQACKQLRHEKILARIISATEEGSAVLSLIENLQREDLNPIDEALGFAQLTNHFGLKQEEIAQRVGKARASIANSLRLLQLEEEIQILLKNNQISSGHAKLLLSVSDSEHRLALAKRVSASGMSVRELESFLAKIKESKEEKKSLSLPESLIHELKNWERQIAAKLNAPVVLKNINGDKGKIVISYESSNELKSILEALSVKV